MGICFHTAFAAAVISSSFGILLILPVTDGSRGDRSGVYQNCLHHCSRQNCTSADTRPSLVTDLTPTYLQLLLWSCSDECRYECMWQTVDVFLKKGWSVPQFHGKWPFVRVFGVQEPASVIFSVLNLLCHVVMFRKFKQLVPSSAPLYTLWQVHSLISLNAWIWSAVFHTRDIPFTEMMDYFCAFSMVLFSLYAMCVRVLLPNSSDLKFLLLTVTFSSFFAHHVWYLTTVKFDYGYNMKANITVGLLNVSGWIAWCGWNIRRQPYVWRCLLFVILVCISTLLELGDFPPLAWTFDAHSLWHLSTAALPLLWYRFVIDDSLYLEKLEEKNKDKKSV